jgi:hypothetical protein
MFTKAVQWEMVEEYALKKVRQVKLLEENNRRLRYSQKKSARPLSMHVILTLSLSLLQH